MESDQWVGSIREISDRIVHLQKLTVQQSESQADDRKQFERKYDSLCLGLVEVLDLVERLNSVEGNDDLSKVTRRLQSVLKAQKIQIIDPSGLTPGLVKVLDTRSVASEPDAKVLEICRQGYFIGERILRCAEVITNRVPRD